MLFGKGNIASKIYIYIYTVCYCSTAAGLLQLKNCNILLHLGGSSGLQNAINYSDVIMGAMSPQIASLAIVYSAV